MQMTEVIRSVHAIFAFQFVNDQQILLVYQNYRGFFFFVFFPIILFLMIVNGKKFVH